MNKHQKHGGWGKWGHKQQKGWGKKHEQKHFKNRKPNAYFVFRSKKSGRALDCSQTEKNKNQTVIWEKHGGDNQQFGMIPDGNDCYLVNKQGLYLTIVDNSNSNGAKCYAEPFTGAPGQHFQVQPAQQGSKDFFIFTFCGKCLDVENWGDKDGDVVHQWEVHG